MRPNKKNEILRQAVEIIEHHGFEGLSFESLASETGLSKSGLIYHFPSRKKLVTAVHQYLADVWEEELRAEVGGREARECRPDERLRALVITMASSATRADLVCALSQHQDPEAAAIWDEITKRWEPDPSVITEDATARAAYLVKLLAEGLWMHDHVNPTPLTPEQRSCLVRAVLDLIPS